MKAKIGHTCDPGPVVSKGHFNFLGADYSLVNLGPMLGMARNVSFVTSDNCPVVKLV